MSRQKRAIPPHRHRALPAFRQCRPPQNVGIIHHRPRQRRCWTVRLPVQIRPGSLRPVLSNHNGRRPGQNQNTNAAGKQGSHEVALRSNAGNAQRREGFSKGKTLAPASRSGVAVVASNLRLKPEATCCRSSAAKHRPGQRPPKPAQFQAMATPDSCHSGVSSTVCS